MNQTYEGVIVTAPETRTSKNGSIYTLFAIKVGREVIDCCLWDKFSGGGDNAQIFLGNRLIFSGFFGSEKSKENSDDLFGPKIKTRQFIVKSWYTGKENKAHQISNEFRCNRAETENLLRGRGLIPIRQNNYIQWLGKDNCCVHNGKEKSIIEFCMDILGPQYVEKTLREATAGRISVSKEFSRRYKNNIRAKLYKEALERAGMIEEANKIVVDEVNETATEEAKISENNSWAEISEQNNLSGWNEVSQQERSHEVPKIKVIVENGKARMVEVTG